MHWVTPNLTLLCRTSCSTMDWDTQTCKRLCDFRVGYCQDYCYFCSVLIQTSFDVRPVIEYADVVWHSGLTYKQAGDLERIQRRACRTIPGHQFSTYTGAIKQCNLDRLSERRVDQCLKFARGLVDNPRTSHLLPPTRISTHGRNLRNANNFSQPKIKTNRFKQSPIPYFVSLLNKQ